MNTPRNLIISLIVVGVVVSGSGTVLAFAEQSDGTNRQRPTPTAVPADSRGKPAPVAHAPVEPPMQCASKVTSPAPADCQLPVDPQPSPPVTLPAQPPPPSGNCAPTTLPCVQPAGTAVTAVPDAELQWAQVPDPTFSQGQGVIVRSRDDALRVLHVDEAPRWISTFPFSEQALVLLNFGSGDGCNSEGIAGLAYRKSGAHLVVHYELVSTLRACTGERPVATAMVYGFGIARTSAESITGVVVG